MPGSGKKQGGLAGLLAPIENKILNLNTECLIPIENGVCPGPVAGCHVISASHLALLDSERVCAWPHLPRVVGAIFLGERLAKGNFRKGKQSPPGDYAPPGSHLIEQFPPKPVGIKSAYAKVTFACNPHDSTIFRSIAEPGKLNPDDQETRFKLGFISVLGTTTFVNSLLKYMRSYLHLDPTVIRNTKKDPAIRKYLRDCQSDGIRPLQQLSENLSEQLVRWNQTYLEKSWDKARTAVVSAHSPIHIAGTGSFSLEGESSNSIAIILPQPDLDRFWIFSTELLDEPLNIKGQADTASHLLKDAQGLKHIIENGEPEEWIGAMAQHWPFFFVSRTDWTKKLDARQKQAIEIKAAQKFAY